MYYEFKKKVDSKTIYAIGNYNSNELIEMLDKGWFLIPDKIERIKEKQNSKNPRINKKKKKKVKVIQVDYEIFNRIRG